MSVTLWVLFGESDTAEHLHTFCVQLFSLKQQLVMGLYGYTILNYNLL